MDLIDSDYQDGITSQSRMELEKLSCWQKENLGEWSVVIGGWAVWSYYPKGFGSRDIDIVLPEDKIQQTRIIEEYFPIHEIHETKKSAFSEEKYYAKKIFYADEPIEIVFDLFYPQTPRPDNENLGFKVDWTWVITHCNEIPLENSSILVPTPSLLSTLKIIAALSRMEEMKGKYNDRRIRSKLWKDYYDVANLCKYVDVDDSELIQHMNGMGITEKHRNQFLDGYIERTDILETVGIKIDKISQKIPKPD